MNNEQQQIIDEAYENYKDSRECQWTPTYFPTPYTQEEFINKSKTDNEFSEKWGLKIEEQELSRKERGDYYYKHGNSEGIVEGSLDRPIWENDETAHKWYDERNIPTKLITITYKEQTIESYE